MANKTFLVCDGDALGRRALTQVASEHGFTTVGEADTVVEALQMLRYLDVDVVVIANELQGLTGLEVVPEMVADGYRVVFVAGDESALGRTREAGAFAAVPRGDLRVQHALAGIRRRSSPVIAVPGIDRRTNPDRPVASRTGRR